MWEENDFGRRTIIRGERLWEENDRGRRTIVNGRERSMGGRTKINSEKNQYKNYKRKMFGQEMDSQIPATPFHLSVHPLLSDQSAAAYVVHTVKV